MTHDCQFDGPVPDPDALDAAALQPRVPCGDPEHCASHGECIDYGDELAEPLRTHVVTGDPLPLPLSIPHTLKVDDRLYVVDEVAVDDEDDTLRLLMRRRYTLNALDPVDAVAIGTLDPERARPAPTAQPPVAGDELDDAVRIVEDAIDATSDEWTDEDGRRVSSPSDRTGRAVVDELLEAGWQPPDVVVGFAVLLDGHVYVVTREHPGTPQAPGFTVRPLTFRRVW